MDATDASHRRSDGPAAASTPRPGQARRNGVEHDDGIVDVWRLAARLWPALRALGYRSGTLGGRGGDADILAGRPPDQRRHDGLDALARARREAFGSFVAQIPARYPHVDITIRHQARDLVTMPEHRGRLDVVLQGVPFKQWTCPPGAARIFAQHATDFLRGGLLLTRRGGISINLVHQQFLDAPTPGLRRQIARRADLVGALRLPPRPVPGHPMGHEPAPPVDVVVLRRRPLGAARPTHTFVDLATTTVDGHTTTLNGYYARHPGNVLGDLVPGRKGHPTMLAPVADREGLGVQIEHALARMVADATRRGLTAPGFQRPPEPAQRHEPGLGL
ncbi:hypothetical protein ACIGB8_27115 [Promicromonospora sukumoe]|uniref:hypothetical protein n=1 Tax=Promicromonospora sukumoe TaxID=88382 RepID=UPI0037C922EF